MRPSVVIPNWNGLRYLEPLFDDLKAQTQPPEEILLIDNGSTDTSCEYAASRGARVVRFESNLGFAAAVNRGVSEARQQAVAVLNNDLRLRPGWLEHTVAALARTDTSYVVGKVLDSTGTRIDGTWDALSCGGAAWRCGHGQPDGGPWSTPRPIHFPPFTAILLRKTDFLTAGGLDEALESYLEDVEFGLRCASKGYTGWYEPAAVASHLGSATLGRWHPRTIRQISRNQLLILSRHYTPQMLRRFGWRIAVAQVLWGFVAARHGSALAWVQGKFEGIRSFRKLRGEGCNGLIPVLEKSEAEIRQYYPVGSPDLYWRLYFALT